VNAMRNPRSSGVTLIELLVAVAISAVVLVGVLGVAIAQQRAAYEGHRQRAAQNSARSALLTVEQALQVAGYGLDAPLTFDMGRYQGPCPTELNPCPRDSTENDDEIVFYSRNPRYWTPSVYTSDPAGNAWRLKAVSNTSVTLYGRAGDGLRRGQVLQAVCKGGAKYAYFTVHETKPALGAAGDLTYALDAVVASDPMKRQDLAVDPCFTAAAGPARVFLVDRYRFHVRPVVSGGAKIPFLMLDTGTDTDGDGNVDEADEVFVAEGVELLQFAYVLTNSNLQPRGLASAMPLTAAEPAAASTTGDGMTTLVFPSAAAPSGTQTIYDVVSWYPYSVGPPAAPPRLTDHQANIRAIRMGMVVRSPTAGPDRADMSPLAPLYNMTKLPSWLDASPFNRFHIEATVPLRNMAVRGMSDS